jgi:putative two-component system response regulator
MNRPPAKPTAIPQPPSAEAPWPAWHRYVAEIAACLRETLARTDAERLVIANSGMMILQGVPPDIVTVERIEALQSIAQIKYVSGNPLGGLEPAVEALSLARKLGDRLTLARCLNMVACTLGDTVDVAGAIEFYHEALDLAVDLKHPRAECAIWANLAVSLIYAAQCEESIRCSERAAQLGRTHVEAAPHLGVALANTALACLHLGDTRRGLAAAKDAVDTRGEPRDANDLLNRVLAETYYARLLLEVADHDTAKVRCAMAKTYAERLGSARAMLSASIAEGLVEVASGKVEVGLTRLKHQLEQARVIRTAYRDTLLALITAHRFLNDACGAEIHVRELVEHTRTPQRQYLRCRGEERLAGLSRAAAPMVLCGPDAFANTEEAGNWQILTRFTEAAILRLDPTGERPYRVSRLARLLAQARGFSPQECRSIELSTRLHDIGMSAMPDSILLKAAKLTYQERRTVELHAAEGASLLGDAKIARLAAAQAIARHHHERFDGSGYPDALRGLTIPLEARIAALADAFDAMTHDRPFRAAISVDEALREIRSERGKQFDPELTDLFVELVSELRRSHTDLDSFLAHEAGSSPFLTARRKLGAALDAELTAREAEVALVLARGASNKQIAAALGISEYTARDHISNLLRKCGVRSRAELAVRFSSRASHLRRRATEETR